MKKFLAYIGLIQDNGKTLSPEGQENFGKGIFIFTIIAVIVLPILMYFFP